MCTHWFEADWISCTAHSVWLCSFNCWEMHVYSLVFKQIVQYCPEGFFEKEDFTSAATELYIKHLHVTFERYFSSVHLKIIF